MGEQSTSSPSAGVDFTPIFVSKLKKSETSPSQESVRTVSSKNVSFAQFNPEYISVPYSAPQDSDSDEIQKELVDQGNGNKEKYRNDGLSLDNTVNKENDKFWEFCYKEMTRADGEGNFPKVDKLNDLLIKIDSDNQVQKNVVETSSKEKSFEPNEEEPKNTSKDKNRKSSRTNNKRSNKEMARTSNKEIAKTSNKASSKTSNKGSPKTSNKGSPKTSNKKLSITKEATTNELFKNPSQNKMFKESSKVGDTISIIFNLCRGESHRINSDADLPCCYRQTSGDLKVSKSDSKEAILKKTDSNGRDVVIVCTSSEKTSQDNLKRRNSSGKDVRPSGSKSKYKKSRSSKNSLESVENASSREDVGNVSKRAKKEKRSKDNLKRIDSSGEDVGKVSKRASKEKPSKDKLKKIDSSGEDVRASGSKSKRKKSQPIKNSLIIMEDDPSGEHLRTSTSKKKRKKSHSSEDFLKTPESDSSGEDVRSNESKKKRKKSHSSEDFLKTPKSDSSGEDVRLSESKKKRKKSNSGKSSLKSFESDSSEEEVRAGERKKKRKKSRPPKSSLKTSESDSSGENVSTSESKKKAKKSRSGSSISFADDPRDIASGDSRNGINVLFPEQESKEVLALDSSDQAVQGTIVYDRGVQGPPRSGRRLSRTRIHRETGPNVPISQTSSSANTSPGRRRILPRRSRSNQRISDDDRVCQDGYRKEGTEKIKCVGVFRSFILRKKCNEECPGKPGKNQGGKPGKSKNKSTQEKMQTDKNTDTESFKSEDRKKSLIQRLKGMVLTDLMQNGELCKPKKKGDDVGGCPRVKKKSH